MRKTLLLISLSALCFFAMLQTPAAQEGGILLNTSEALEGYTLINHEVYDKAVLIDNCGHVVNEWDIGNVGYHPKLLPNGNLLYENNEIIFEVDWDNNIVETTALSSEENETLDLLYEVIVLENNNYLCVGRRDFELEEFMAIGYNLSGVFPRVVDVVVELERGTGDIVWEWRISDHVIQQRDENLPNYGILAENPQLLNMDAISTYDWASYESFMINGMDYNPTLDQVALSVRKMSEVVIIDHSTTTEEAAGSTGGNSGKGGDILYRWGNPQNYNRGTAEDRQLFFQHNPNWITEGPYAGHLIMYDNGLNRPVESIEDRYSTAPIINPPMDVTGNYVMETDSLFGPATPVRQYSRINGDAPFFSGYTSGAEWLPNGNVYITEGINGYLKELNSDGELVWEYQVPYISYIFRTEKYAADYPAFEGKDLMPQGPIDGALDTLDCMLFTTSTFSPVEEALVVQTFYDNVSQAIRLTHDFEDGLDYVLRAINGRELLTGYAPWGTREINTNNYPAGLYLLSLSAVSDGGFITKKILLHE